MSGICEGRVVIVTGAGRGLGRSHALKFADEGARLLINDSGVEVDGRGSSKGPADSVAEEIRQSGGEVVVSYADAAEWKGAEELVTQAIDEYGSLDTLVNNVGILRDKMLINMTDTEWDEVIRVHLGGTFAPSHWAAQYWRGLTKEGVPVDGRIISTSSGSGLYGNVGQTNYGAAKAGIAAFTIIAAKELSRYGVTANAIAPGARTRMTAGLGLVPDDPTAAFDARSPDNVSPLVVWLGSAYSGHITGRIFNIWGGHLSVAEGWHAGPGVDNGDRFDVAEIGAIVDRLVHDAAPAPDVWGRYESGTDA